jgi:hypothetical protein
VCLDLEASAWHATTFTKNRQRLLDGAIASQFLARVLGLAKSAQLLSREHFSVDDTLLEAWASQKSVRALDEDDLDRPVDPDNTGVSFRDERRTNATHGSVTDPDARMARKSNSTASILEYQVSMVTENRSGLVLGTFVSSLQGHAEVEDALVLLQSVPKSAGPVTVGADKGCDTVLLRDSARALGVTPHFAAKSKGGAIDWRTTRHAGYAVSQQKRKASEEVLGWLKTVSGLR